MALSRGMNHLISPIPSFRWGMFSVLILSLFSSFFAQFVCTHSSLAQGLDNLISSFFSGYFHINFNLSRPRCCLFFPSHFFLMRWEQVATTGNENVMRISGSAYSLLAVVPTTWTLSFIQHVIWSLMDSFQETTSFFFAGTSHNNNNNSENIKKSWIYLLYGIQSPGQRPSSGSLDSRHITSRASGMRERSWKNGEMELNEFNIWNVSRSVMRILMCFHSPPSCDSTIVRPADETPRECTRLLRRILDALLLCGG